MMQMHESKWQMPVEKQHMPIQSLLAHERQADMLHVCHFDNRLIGLSTF